MKTESSMITAVRVITIAIFLTILVMPTLQSEFQLFSYEALNENRNRKEKPDAGIPNGTILERLYRQGVEFSQNYEHYFNDRYGFRDLLIKTKNQIDLSVFGVSDDVVLGKNGFLFPKKNTEEDLIAAERVTPAQMQQMMGRILTLHKILRERGISLIVMLCREKESIYGDFLPSNTATRRPPTRADLYVKLFSQHPEVPLIDTQEVLMNLRSKESAFYKTDFHWNTVGASEAGKLLIATIAKLEGSDAKWADDITVEDVPGYSGTQNLYLATFSPATEIAREVKKDWPVSGALDLPPPYPFDSVYRTRKESRIPARGTRLPITTVLGNSFSTYFFKTPIPEYFEGFGYVFKGHGITKNLNSLLVPGSKYMVLQVSEFDLGTYWMPDHAWNFTHDL